MTLQSKGLLLGGTMSGIPTSIDNMIPTNRFIVGLSAIPIADGVIAHIDGVASEKIVQSAHSMQGNPETIQEVKRILIEHANSLP